MDQTMFEDPKEALTLLMKMETKCTLGNTRVHIWRMVPFSISEFISS
jgi:hypothetical protein